MFLFLERTMNEQLNLLIQLQEIDLRIRARRDERDRIPVRLAELEQRAEANKAGVEGARHALEDAQKSKRERDRDLEAGAEKVQKLKARTSEIKTNKEYTALLKEIETAEQENKAIEDDILKLMEKIEQATAEITVAEARAAEEHSSIADDSRRLQEEGAASENALKADEQSRDELASRIDRQVLGQYERLVGPKNGRAIVEARGEACSGCFMSIPPQLFVNVKRNESIIDCPNCHRILYYKEVIAPKGA
jgi:predicted  nucleic acid-binding Zn-ribbon protein